MRLVSVNTARLRYFQRAYERAGEFYSFPFFSETSVVTPSPHRPPSCVRRVCRYTQDVAIKIPVVIVRQTTSLAIRKIIARDDAVHAQIVAKHWTVKGEFPVGPCAEAAAAGAPAEEQVQLDAAGNVIADAGLRLALGEEGGQIALETDGLSGVDQTRFEYLYGRFGGPRPQRVRQLVRALRACVRACVRACCCVRCHVGE